MDLVKLDTVIAHGETETVEYKKSLAELDKLGKALCGLLNAQGGHGFVGITDAGKIIGTEVTDATKKKLTAFKNYFDPWPPIDIKYIDLVDTDKKIIVFECKSTENTGHYTYKGKSYVKTPSGIQPMPAEKYKNLLLQHAGLSKVWESLPANEFTLADLDHNEVRKTFKIGLQEGRIPTEEDTDNIVEILTHFDLIQDGVLTNGAMALFAQKMPADYSQCFIRMGRFVDEDMDVVIDSKQIRGNAFQLFREATEFVRKHLPIASRFELNNFERIDEMALPYLAVREAILNAICHRDYSVRAGDISLCIFNDSLEIHNIGHLFDGLTVEQLSVAHPSRRRNERMAQVFYVRKLIDRFGVGTRRILSLCAAQNLPPPEFSEKADGFQIRFVFKESIGPQKLVKVARPKLTMRQTEIVQILKEQGALSTNELRERLSNPPKVRWMRYELNQLDTMGLIKAQGATTNRKWQLTC